MQQQNEQNFFHLFCSYSCEKIDRIYLICTSAMDDPCNTILLTQYRGTIANVDAKPSNTAVDTD